MIPKKRSQLGITAGDDIAQTIIESGGFSRAELNKFHIPAVLDERADEGTDRIDHAKVLEAVYGRDTDEFAAAVADDLRRRPSRPHIFETKSHYRYVRPTVPDETTQLIGETEFAEMYAAADFAAYCQLWFDTTITLNWTTMGLEGQAEEGFESFMKCLREWWPSGAPLAFIYAHERGPDSGLHTHIALFACPTFRTSLRAWAMGWVERRLGSKVKKAVRVRIQKTTQPWLHWVTTSYLMKGYDRTAVVVSARNSPDGKAVYLGDIIAAPWRNPGSVPFRKRTGTSASLKVGARKKGLPNGVQYPARTRWEYKIISLFPKVIGEKVPAEGEFPPFRSKYEDGIRDVRKLYPDEFLKAVRHGLGIAAAPTPLPTAEEIAAVLPEY